MQVHILQYEFTLDNIKFITLKPFNTNQKTLNAILLDTILNYNDDDSSKI